VILGQNFRQILGLIPFETHFRFPPLRKKANLSCLFKALVRAS